MARSTNNRMTQEGMSNKEIVMSKLGKLKTAGDKKVCDICGSKAGMAGETPPFHPNCRCRIVGNKVFNEAGVPLRSYSQGTYNAEGVQQ